MLDWEILRIFESYVQSYTYSRQKRKMWTSNIIETYPKQFDFSSSEQGKPTYNALKIGDYEFSNLIESIELGDEYNFQNIICDHCGYSGCASGNWLSIRKYNEFAFFIPDFEDMKDEDFGANFEPSYYFRKNGSLYLGKNEFAIFNKIIQNFTKFEDIPKFTKKELIELYKWDVPQRMFGDFPNYTQINKKRIIATSEFDQEKVVKIIMHKIEELTYSNFFNLQLLEKEENKITIYLDDQKTTEWNALYKENDEIGLLLGGKFKITTE